MEYAVVRVGGKQYKVTPGQTLEIDKLANDGKTVVLDDVLLFVNDGKLQVGKPSLSNVKVTAKVLGDIKGEKIRVLKFKAKSRYRRALGFRAQHSLLQIETIDSGQKKAAEPKIKKTSVKAAPKNK